MKEGYKRVTEILYPFSGLENIDRDIVAHAAERGSRVHKICEGIVKGLGEFGVDDEVWGYVSSFNKWWDNGVGKEVLAIERRFYCDTFKITGQVDLVIRQDDKIDIIDYKTSSRPSKTWLAQGSAYAYLCGQSFIQPDYVHFLHLNKHGKSPKIHEYAPDPTFFFHCYHVYMHFYHKEK